jgi:hypothetical protein
MLTELDFGKHCLECNEEGLIAPSQDPERFDPTIYQASIRPDPRPWGNDPEVGAASEGSRDSAKNPISAETP